MVEMWDVKLEPTNPGRTAVSGLDGGRGGGLCLSVCPGGMWLVWCLSLLMCGCNGDQCDGGHRVVFVLDWIALCWHLAADRARFGLASRVSFFKEQPLFIRFREVCRRFSAVSGMLSDVSLSDVICQVLPVLSPKSLMTVLRFRCSFLRNV